MAIADILAKIESDAAAEAARILDAAQAEAAAIVAEYEELAATERVAAHEAAEQRAIQRAETILVNARLRERDRTLALKRSLVEGALEQVADAVAGLPDDAYAALMAREVVAVARGGEHMRFGAGDRYRAELIADVVARLWAGPGPGPVVSGEAAPFTHGVLLQGDRTSVNLSVTAVVEARRRELETLLLREMLGGAAGGDAARDE